MVTKSPVNEREERDAVQVILNRLSKFDDDTRGRIFRSAQAFFGLDTPAQVHRPTGSSGMSSTVEARTLRFSDREVLPPKEFIFQKQPKTDPGKTSLKGRVTVVRDFDGSLRCVQKGLNEMEAMVSIYFDGGLLFTRNFDEVREAARS